MKKIGIIFAMRKELDELLEYVHIVNEKKIFDITFYEGSVGNNILTMVECGIGKVNASRVTQLLIDNYEVDYIFNVGVAGSVSKEVGVCDIVIGEKLTQYDFDITAFGYELGVFPKIGRYIESDKYLLDLCHKYDDESIHYGVIASADKFQTDDAESKKVQKEFNALCVEMEGASVAHVAYLCNKPFIIIRCISDSIYEHDNKIEYEEFVKISSKKVATYLNKLLGEIE